MMQYKKAIFIAAQLEMNADDVLDIMLGHITRPKEDVQAVLSASLDYDRRQAEGDAKTRLDS